jgi:hypothetical protein
MANLLEISRDLVSRTPEGKEALLAMRAIRDWKFSSALRHAHKSVSAYYTILTELHSAGKLKLKGESFMSSDPKKDGSELGLALHKLWTEDPALREKHGSFKAFVESERKAEDEGIRERTKVAGGGR